MYSLRIQVTTCTLAKLQLDASLSGSQCSNSSAVQLKYTSLYLWPISFSLHIQTWPLDLAPGRVFSWPLEESVHLCRCISHVALGYLRCLQVTCLVLNQQALYSATSQLSGQFISNCGREGICMLYICGTLIKVFWHLNWPNWLGNYSASNSFGMSGRKYCPSCSL